MGSAGVVVIEAVVVVVVIEAEAQDLQPLRTPSASIAMDSVIGLEIAQRKEILESATIVEESIMSFVIARRSTAALALVIAPEAAARAARIALAAAVAARARAAAAAAAAAARRSARTLALAPSPRTDALPLRTSAHAPSRRRGPHLKRSLLRSELRPKRSSDRLLEREDPAQRRKEERGRRLPIR